MSPFWYAEQEKNKSQLSISHEQWTKEQEIINSYTVIEKLQFWKRKRWSLFIFDFGTTFMTAYSCLIGKIHFNDFVSISGASVYLNFIIVPSDMPK